MELNTLSDIKKELTMMPPEKVVLLCMALAKYKKENKELLNYLLFEAHSEENYINKIKIIVNGEFSELNTNNLYFAKKGIRRILKMIKKYIKYSGKKETEVELLLFFCQELEKTNLPIYESKVLLNIYQRLKQAINKALMGLHEDLQADYAYKIAGLKIQ